MNGVVNLPNINMPVTGGNVVALAAIGAIEFLIFVAIMNEYSVEVSAETTKNGVKGNLKFYAE